MRDDLDTESGKSSQNWLNNVRVSLMFLSRLPVPDVRRHPPSLASAMGAFPLAGLLIGLLAGAACGLASAVGLPASVSAVATIAFLALLTGGLHEDGLADVADGFGGGQSVERKLAIMKDSRIGTYGMLALVFAVLLKVTALTAILQTNLGFFALLGLFGGLGAWSRSLCVALMATTPNARGDGVAAHAGQPTSEINRSALGLGAAALGLLIWPAFGLWSTLAVFAGSCAAFWLVRRLALRHIGGHTGDVAGSVQ
ncbi:MAG: adenosylcobinamide-GDP ribazoletransferase, partial [Rhizobiales bacterium]|nr:adenosylcobinamide-GDP ribazoletransferase [Hyphomicrobiales bacterium]